jgi:hypothetical protein
LKLPVLDIRVKGLAMIPKLRHIVFTLGFTASLCSTIVIAQSSTANSEDSETPSSQPASVVTKPEATSSESTGQVSETQYVPALDGTGLIAMNAPKALQLLIGGTVSGGWDSNPEDLTGGKSTSVYALSPYVGIQANGSRTQFLFQYQPTITRYSSYSAETMQTVSAKLLGNLSPRVNWTLGLHGSHGEDSVRLLAPADSTTVGDQAGITPTSAAYLQNAGTVTDLQGEVSLHFNRTQRDSFDFHLSNSFDRVAGLNQSDAVATMNLAYSRNLSPALALLGYQQTSYYYYGPLKCTTFGIGAGFSWQPRQDTFLSIKGGPQLDTPSCGTRQGLSYTVKLATKLTGKSQIYFLAERQPVTAYLGPGLWQDGVSGGYQRQLSSRDTVTLDAGFVTSTTLTNLSSYTGGYFDSSYVHSFRRGLSTACTFRSFLGSTDGANFNRNVALVSVTWTPNGHPIAQ